MFALGDSMRKSYRPASVEPWIDPLNAFEEVASTEVKSLGCIVGGGRRYALYSRKVPSRPLDLTDGAVHCLLLSPLVSPR